MMEEYIKVSGSIIEWMVMGYVHGVMVENIKGNM